jgi:hypothetical protein
MDDICTRIRRITTDLNALEEELEWQKIEATSQEEQAQLLEEILSVDLMSDFKAAVDRVRHFLWRYIESAANNNGQDVDYALQSHRLRRVTEMLRMLRNNGVPEMATLPEERTFFEHVTSVIERYNFDQAAPAPPASKKAA